MARTGDQLAADEVIVVQDLAEEISESNIGYVYTSNGPSNPPTFQAPGAGSGDMTKIVYDPTNVSGDAFNMDNMQEGTTNKILTSSERSAIALNTAKNSYPSADATKLAGIQDNATANQTDAYLLSRSNHTGTQEASTISDFDTAVSSNTDVISNNAKVSADGSIDTHSDVNTSTNPPTDGQSLVWNNLNSEWRPGTVSGGGDTVNYYNTFKAPQLFNPDSTGVSTGTDVFTLSNGAEIGFVTINGQTLDDSEYSLSGSDLTVTPDNGFNATDDEILVFQTKLTATGLDLGWGYYQDSTYTEGSPLSINNARVQLTIDGLGTNTNTTYLPASGDLWDTINNKVIMNSVGDSYNLRIDFKCKAGSNNSFFDIQLDIGDGSSIIIVEDTLQMVKGINTEQRFSKTISGFALGTFISNGGKIYLDSTDDAVNLSVYDIAILITKTK